MVSDPRENRKRVVDASTNNCHILEKLLALRANAVFAGLSDSQLIGLTGQLVERRVRKGELVIREGDAWVGPYLLVSGKTKAFRMSVEGRRQLVAASGPGRLIAVGWAPDASAPNTIGGQQLLATYAVSDCVLYLIPKDVFIDLIQTNPEVASRVLVDMVRRMSQVFDLAANLSLSRAPARVAAYLLKLARETGPSPTGSATIKITVARMDVAEAVGVAEETVVRILASFRKQGLIDLHYRHILIKDLVGLAKWAE